MPPQTVTRSLNLNCVHSSEYQEREEVNKHGDLMARWRAFSETGRQDSRYLHPRKHVG